MRDREREREKMSRNGKRMTGVGTLWHKLNEIKEEYKKEVKEVEVIERKNHVENRKEENTKRVKSNVNGEAKVLKERISIREIHIKRDN